MFFLITANVIYYTSLAIFHFQARQIVVLNHLSIRRQSNKTTKKNTPFPKKEQVPIAIIKSLKNTGEKPEDNQKNGSIAKTTNCWHNFLKKQPYFN